MNTFEITLSEALDRAEYGARDRLMGRVRRAGLDDFLFLRAEQNERSGEVRYYSASVMTPSEYADYMQSGGVWNATRKRDLR